ncbi:Proposed peptidoglycan lipid II flippase MurJ [Marinilactibacillus psychrotolerans 42ea]|uniref:Probable lipid II flippase MurJ n=1 Tax=Marinilactibacillus psychrotolerans 42ea TaxID=1255609 RepID=A0A1R4K103_9LACT|nr:murein biosynthesis integral membrane protein MurJ [Marinilactibacillus psychrotolerans]SJN37844.1 Proposed peptidoglycan lipid II flippase MurJ [Marinilactibacillus psychrotolerans 42ea]
MKKTALLLIILTIVSKFIGFGRELTLSYFYGTSDTSDAYLISLIIPTVIFAFIGSAISTGYIPMYNLIEKKQGSKQAYAYTNNLMSILLIASSVIIILGLLFTEQIVRVFASGFEGETLNLAIKFTKVSLFGIYFTSLVYLMKSFLEIKGNYAVPALIGLPMNFVIIVSIIISSKGSTIILAIGLLLGMFAQFVYLIPSVMKKGLRFKIVLDFNDPHIKKMFLLVLPVLLGVAVNDINKIVDKTLASQITSGGISALTYANTLNNVVIGIFALSISTAMYPLISKMAVEGNMTELKKSVSEAIGVISLLIIPVTVGIMIFAEPIIRLLFGRGAFDVDSIIMTSSVLFFYSLGMLGVGLREVLSRPFYAMQDTITPMINATIGVVINIILNILLSRYMGLAGLALATSIAAFVTSGLLFISLRKKVGSLGIKKISKTCLKILFAALLMGLLSKTLFFYLNNIFSQNLSLVITIIIGVATYFIIIYFMKIDDVDIIVRTIKRKLGKTDNSIKNNV